MAHRDNAGTFLVHRDNSSGTGALVELARAYTGSGGATGVKPQHTIVFLSTDGGAFGGLGARYFADHAPEGKNVLAVVNLDTIATNKPPQIEISGPGPHSSSTTLLGSAVARIGATAGMTPGRPSLFGQLIDLAFPLSLYEQWPFLQHGISAITLTTAGDRPSSDPVGSGVRRPAARPDGAGGAAARELARPGTRAFAGNEQLRVLRGANHQGLGAGPGADRTRRPVRSRGGRPLRALPTASRPARRRVPRLSPPARLLALGGRALRAVRALRSLPGRGGRTARPRLERGRKLATGGAHGLRTAGGAELARRAQAARGQAAGDRRGGARGPDRGPAGARPDLAARDGDERLRARPLPAVAARLVVASAGAQPRSDRPRVGLRGRSDRARAPARPRGETARARTRYPLVPCGADRNRLRTDSGRRARSCLGRGRRAAPRRDDRPLRALSGTAEGARPGAVRTGVRTVVLGVRGRRRTAPPLQAYGDR